MLNYEHSNDAAEIKAYAALSLSLFLFSIPIPLGSLLSQGFLNLRNSRGCDSLSSW